LAGVNYMKRGSHWHHAHYPTQKRKHVVRAR